MKVEREICLKEYTTFKMGGTAKIMYTPETPREAVEIIKEHGVHHCIGGGSNLLVTDSQLIDCVINLREFDKSICLHDNGIIEVGASVRLQKLINEINDMGYGGIEYLFSVPGLVGGAVVMNAGRGKLYNQCISDYIVKVKVCKDGEVYYINKKDCEFGYRSSIFKNSSILVMGVQFLFPQMGYLETQKAKKERIDLCRRLQDNSLPNFGSVFSESNPRIMNIFKNTFLGRCGKVHFSSKTPNWMLNDGGSSIEALRLLRRVEIVHKILRKKCKREVIIW